MRESSRVSALESWRGVGGRPKQQNPGLVHCMGHWLLNPTHQSWWTGLPEAALILGSLVPAVSTEHRHGPGMGAKRHWEGLRCGQAGSAALERTRGQPKHVPQCLYPPSPHRQGWLPAFCGTRDPQNLFPTPVFFLYSSSGSSTHLSETHRSCPPPHMVTKPSAAAQPYPPNKSRRGQSNSTAGKVFA